MDVYQKINVLSQEAGYEVSEREAIKSIRGFDIPENSGSGKQKFGSSHEKVRRGLPAEKMPIFNAAAGGGKRVPLLKILLTSVCENNCNYCGCRSGRDFERFEFKADELAKAFMSMVRAGLVQGLFLSSGVAGGGVRTQDRLLATADILRNKMGYKGYLHLKIMPGAEWDQIYAGMRLANRVSVNLESPNTTCLKMLAPKKQFLEQLLLRIRWIDEIRQKYPARYGWGGKWPSSTTQFVVGAVPDSDQMFLRTSTQLHRELRLQRVYYAKFNPVHGTPLEEKRGEDPKRIQRLYQADFLIRDYGYQLGDFQFNGHHNLSLDIDPKLAWASMNLYENPIEINQAERSALLRIPGIGPKRADMIISERKKSKIASLNDLRSIGILCERFMPFILINGKQPDHQLPLW